MYYSYSFWWPPWKSVVAAEVQWDNMTQMKERCKKVLFLKFWEDMHPLCTLHRHLAVDQGAPVRQPCGQAGVCTPSTASESENLQPKAIRTGNISIMIFFFFLILSLHCSPLQIKTTNKNLTWAFESRLCSTGCCEEAGKTHLLLCFLQAHKGQPEELRRVTMATHKAGQRAQHRYSACPLWVGSCLLTRINAQTILIYTTYNYATVNAEYNVIIFPYITHYLLDSFSKADGESSGVNLIWAFNGYVISITG